MSSSKMSPTFVVLALGLLGVSGGVAFFSPSSAAGGARSEARTSLWLTEIDASVRAQPCPSHGARAEEVASQTIEGIPIWAERERVDVSQVLRSWRAVEVALKCASVTGPHETRTRLERERSRLRTLLSENLRSWHTAYARASDNQRDQEAKRALQGLLFLLSVHPGGLRGDLERALRRLEKNGTE